MLQSNDFNVENKERSGTPKKFGDEELEVLLHQDLCLAKSELTESLGGDHTTDFKILKALRMSQKQGH